MLDFPVSVPFVLVPASPVSTLVPFVVFPVPPISVFVPLVVVPVPPVSVLVPLVVVPVPPVSVLVPFVVVPVSPVSVLVPFVVVPVSPVSVLVPFVVFPFSPVSVLFLSGVISVSPVSLPSGVVSVSALFPSGVVSASPVSVLSPSGVVSASPVSVLSPSGVVSASPVSVLPPSGVVSASPVSVSLPSGFVSISPVLPSLPSGSAPFIVSLDDISLLISLNVATVALSGIVSLLPVPKYDASQAKTFPSASKYTFISLVASTALSFNNALTASIPWVSRICFNSAIVYPPKICPSERLSNASGISAAAQIRIFPCSIPASGHIHITSEVGGILVINTFEAVAHAPFCASYKYPSINTSINPLISSVDN